MIDDIKILTHDNEQRRKKNDHVKSTIEKQIKEFNDTKKAWNQHLEQ
jgi:hypothetical protein